MATAVIVGSVILGLCLVFAVVFAAIIVTFGERRTTNLVGRFRIVQTGDGNCFLLDTRTGRLWERRAGSPAWSENADVPWITKADGRRAPRADSSCGGGGCSA
jgi:hypothetical protein